MSNAPCQNASSRPSNASGETPAFRLSSGPYHLPLSRLLQAILVCCLAVVMLGAGDTAEKRYERVGHNMMCACGCGQILLECNHVSCPSSGPMTIRAQTATSRRGLRQDSPQLVCRKIRGNGSRRSPPWRLRQRRLDHPHRALPRRHPRHRAHHPHLEVTHPAARAPEDQGHVRRQHRRTPRTHSPGDSLLI